MRGHLKLTCYCISYNEIDYDIQFNRAISFERRDGALDLGAMGSSGSSDACFLSGPFCVLS